MEWLRTLQDLYPSIELTSGATDAEVLACEQGLGLLLPDDLKSLLAASDGVLGEYELGLVWPAERIKSDNLQFRSDPSFPELYMPFDSLLFFGDAGNGDQFAFPIQAGEVRRPDIFVWSHEDDSRTWIAPSLGKFLQWWVSGHIKV
ncbi:SMI1/KNR4 family protein [uncultured Pseudoxanthomonas sp.]|uniref:SMI1/KNR4 family protein n=1 Tax=uncultured Pseudoxanthomonas sp. TaxID=281701 RepID=UPI0026148BB1|nr:SMI1/KNR4 family protein [uncultured Pseudoxanthomonas sp.]